MPNFLSVGEVAAQLGVAPRHITYLFYARRLDCDRCPVVGDRRVIPSDYIDGIAVELRRAGKLPPLRREVFSARRAH